jgi:DNA ligase-1
VLLRTLAETWQDVVATSSRLAKVSRLAAVLADLAPAETVPGVAYLSGELRQRQIGVGWAALRDLPAPADDPSLTVGAVDATFERIGGLSGPGSQAERRRLLREVFAAATELEQRFLRQLLMGELRQGALLGVMVDAVAKATSLPGSDVRRALLLRGDLREVAAVALAEGAAGLAAFRLEVGRPLAPMLAASAEDAAAALAKTGPAAVDEKLDGARVQVHRSGDEVRVYTRSLDDVTARVPEVVEATLSLPVRTAVLDGEAIALRRDTTPQPFQVTASRFGSRADVPTVRARTPLTPVVFDVLHLDGHDFLDAPARDRFAALAAVTPADLMVRRLLDADPGSTAAFLAESLARGHEGVVVKSLDSVYAAGRRGSGWIKVKPRHTLDLVVLAVEWGHGRRRGWLSNLHLGARDPVGGGFVMLGKTFKGMTDKMLAWQTERLLALEVARDEYTIHVKPELVVEIAFDGVQRSTRYAGGMALRFARVLRYREDKSADQTDTVQTVRALLP